MHIPDGFISAPVAAVGCVVAGGSVAYAVKATKKKMGEKQIPLMGVLAAFIFAAQMLNFPIAGGTSGHFVGAALAAILLGPWRGILIMTCVLVVQCLIFQDGGLFALALFGEGRKRKLIGGGLAAWFSVVIASVACAFELAISGTVPLKIALPVMAGIHALIGIGEGLITAAVLNLIMATRADLLELQKA
jgi:cobalt/nickel transport system permease protein